MSGGEYSQGRAVPSLCSFTLGLITLRRDNEDIVLAGPLNVREIDARSQLDPHVISSRSIRSRLDVFRYN